MRRADLKVFKRVCIRGENLLVVIGGREGERLGDGILGEIGEIDRRDRPDVDRVCRLIAEERLPLG